MPAADFESDLAAIAAEEAALHLRKLLRRQQDWDQTLTSLSLTVQQLLSHGFDRPSIGKALGFTVPKSSSPSKKSLNQSSTHHDWFSIYRATGMRAYLKAHPDFASAMKADKIKTSAYFDHLPPDALQAMGQIARHKAQPQAPSPYTL